MMRSRRADGISARSAVPRTPGQSKSSWSWRRMVIWSICGVAVLGIVVVLVFSFLRVHNHPHMKHHAKNNLFRRVKAEVVKALSAEAIWGSKKKGLVAPPEWVRTTGRVGHEEGLKGLLTSHKNVAEMNAEPNANVVAAERVRATSMLIWTSLSAGDDHAWDPSSSGGIPTVLRSSDLVEVSNADKALLKRGSLRSSHHHGGGGGGRFGRHGGRVHGGRMDRNGGEEEEEEGIEGAEDTLPKNMSPRPLVWWEMPWVAQSPLPGCSASWPESQARKEGMAPYVGSSASVLAAWGSAPLKKGVSRHRPPPISNWHQSVCPPAFTESDSLLAKSRKSGHRLTCAVVGNAASLKGRGLGREIDSYDVVVRVNDAPTLHFEADVGKRTTLRVLNSDLVGSQWCEGGKDGITPWPEWTSINSTAMNHPSPFGHHEHCARPGARPEWSNDHERTLTACVRESCFRRWAGTVAQSHAPGKDHRIMHPAFQCAARSLTSGIFPSTGMLAAFTSLRCCAKTTLYGFDQDLYADPTKHARYHDGPDGPTEAIHTVHDFASEKRTLSLLTHILNNAHSPEHTDSFCQDICDQPEAADIPTSDCIAGCRLIPHVYGTLNIN